MDFVALLSAVPAAVWSWGPAIVVLAGVYALTRKLLVALETAGAAILNTAVKEFIATQAEQAKAMSSQAVSLRDLASCIQVQRAQDRSEMREMMIMLKVLRQEVRDLASRVEPWTANTGVRTLVRFPGPLAGRDDNGED